MTIQRYALELNWDAPDTQYKGMMVHKEGKYVLYTDFISLEARVIDLEYALHEISKLPDSDSYMCREIARDALADQQRLI